MSEARVTSNELRVLSHDALHRGPSSFLAPRNSKLNSRHAVTLIELLIVIAIIATLSTVFLGVSTAAMEHSRASRTKAVIAKIHSLLMERWESYETRRIDLDPSIVSFINGLSISSRERGQVMQDLRIIAHRELMMLEMPDSWSDILLNPVRGDPPLDNPRLLASYPALRQSYKRRYDQVEANNNNSTEDIVANQGAECLYMTIMLATGDGEARTLFGDQDIGDTDDDGAPEFLDGWGRPIEFIRWPAGFVQRSHLMSGNADTDHDPFDVFRRDQSVAPRPGNAIYLSILTVVDTAVRELADGISAFRLVPLIYSAGSDGETDIDDLPYTGGGAISPSSLDPYAIDPDTTEFVYGLPFDKNGDDDDNSLDNIHNHLQDNR